MHIPGRIPIYGQGLMKWSMNLCSTTFIYVVLNSRIMYPIPHPDQFYFLLTTCVWNKHTL